VTVAGAGAATAWADARVLAHRAVGPVAARAVPLAAACGAVLAADARARSDLPVADTAAMDGWAVRGPAPWRVVGEVLAGERPRPLDDGHAVAIATGAVLPPGGDGVLRREWGALDDERLTPAPDAPAEVRSPGPVGIDLRRAGEECRAGDVVLPAGSPVTPAALGLLAAAGLDDVPVRRVRAAVLVLGDELVRHGPARAGRPRDALGPLLPAWLAAIGVEVAPPVAVADDAGELAAALAGGPAAGADVVVTTGSTARGPVDHLHGVLAAAGARWVVDGVAVRPGHPQVLAVLPDGRPVVGLPGNPLAAVSGVLTLLEPVVDGLLGLPPRVPGEVVLAEAVSAGGDATRLVPVRHGRPMVFAGPAMLRGLAAADAVAAVPPGGAAAGESVPALALPGATRVPAAAGSSSPSAS
jgi:molybdopterin molybdotransferase